MGYQLSEAAIEFAAAVGLGHQPARLLFVMAHRARDTDAKPVYFAGREDCALALGISPAVIAEREGIPLDRAQKRAWETVARAIATLREVGAIEVADQARRGSTAVYRLTYIGMGSTQSNPQGKLPTQPIAEAPKGTGSAHTDPEIAMGSTGDSYGLSPQKVWAQPATAMHSAHPLEEEQEEHEGRNAREADATYALDTPPTPPPPDSPFCIHHPGGTTDPCYGCGQARKDYEATHGKTPRRPRSPRPASTTPALVHVDGRDVCADGRHKLTADAKSCILCQIRPEDLAAQLAESAIA